MCGESMLYSYTAEATGCGFCSPPLSPAPRTMRHTPDSSDMPVGFTIEIMPWTQPQHRHDV
jgi:hypothetical protein